MEAIAWSLIPELVGKLRDQALEEHHWKGSAEGKITPPLPDLSSLARCLPENNRGDDDIKSLDEGIIAIDQATDYAIHALETYTGQLRVTVRAHRNSLLPVYRLPDDVLAIIFEFVATASSNRLRPLPTKAPVNISHVCKLWRDISLNTPTLWGSFDALNAHVANTFLERSKNAPLTIDLTSCNDEEFSDDEDMEEPHSRCPVPRALASRAFKIHYMKWREFFQPLLPHVSRWHSLSVEDLDIGLLEKLLLPPAPNLRRLVLRSTERVYQTFEGVVLFSGSTPRLRVLELYESFLPLESSIFSDLHTLRLFGGFYEYGINVATLLLDILARCPLLIELDVWDMRVDEDVLPIVNVPPIPLPHLEKLRLSMVDPFTSQNLLSSIFAPDTLRFTYETSTGDFDDAFPSSSLISTSLLNMSRIRWLSFHRSGSTASVVGGASASDVELLRILIRVEIGEVSDLDPKFARILSPKFPDLSITSLSFDGIDIESLKYDTFVKLLEKYPDVISLTFAGCSPQYLQSLIIDPISRPGLLLGLKELRLENIDLRTEKTTLLAIVKSRATTVQGGARPMQSLVISNCPGLEDLTALPLPSTLLRAQILM